MTSKTTGAALGGDHGDVRRGKEDDPPVEHWFEFASLLQPRYTPTQTSIFTRGT